MNRTVLFDLDGTLVDTTDLILQSFAFTFAAHLPGRLPSREDLVATFGRSLPAALAEMAVQNGAPDPERFAAAMLATYRAFQHEHHDRLIRPFDDIVSTLETLRQRGHALGVVTSKMEQFARRGLALFHLEQYFPVAVFHDDVVKHKPDPEPLLLAADRVGVAPEQVIYVGDSTHDIVAGRAAGMTTVAVLWGPFSRSLLEKARPDHLVARPDELLDLI